MYFAIDLETSGLDVNKDEPVEIAFALVNPEGPYNITSVIVRTEVPCHPKAQEVHGITPDEVALGVSPRVAADLIHMTTGQFGVEGVVGFNVFKYDIPLIETFLCNHLENTHFHTLDLPIEDPAMWYLADEAFRIPRPRTVEQYSKIAKQFIPKGAKYSLAHVCKQYGVELINAHRAAADLDATIKLWRIMRNEERAWGSK